MGDISEDPTGVSEPTDIAHDSTLPPPPHDELQPGTPVGRYVILKKLGAGGMGVVYAAYDEQLDRRVALKLLTSSVRESEGSGAAVHRLLREAQAMAKLSHPNVVAAFDVGTFGDQVFLAMEYVDGSTLRVWRDAKPRTSGEIVAMYVQAGRGLEAAHAAGILHRDFKPENVVVDAKRARVLDFGLARIDAPPASLQDIHLDSTETGLKTPALPLTQYGSLVGTPAYMAPEQLRGEWAETLSDQFSFCVALYEALYGQRPHEGLILRDLLLSMHANRTRPAPPDSDVPRGVRSVILRGLRAEPKERFASMTELLSALETTLPAARTRTAIVAPVVALLVVGAIAAAFAIRSARPPVCAGASSELASAWGEPQRKTAIEHAFLASGNPRAAATWKLVRPALDAYAARWTAMRTESCEATRVRGVQSDEALDLRTACLDQRRSELAATVDLLAGANAKLVDNAVSMVRSLTDLDPCADVPALRAPYAQPHDPAQRRVVAAIRDRIAKGIAMVHARSQEDAIAVLSAAAKDAATAKNLPLEASALCFQGLALNQRGQSKEALPVVLDAAKAASIGRDDLTEAKAWILLIRIAGYDLDDLAASRIYASLADAAVIRAGSPDTLRGDLAQYRAQELYVRGKKDESLVLYREALAFRERAFGPTSAEVGLSELDIADLYADEGRLGEARAMYEGALAKVSAAYGEGNPRAAVVLVNLADLQIEIGDADAAVALARRALSLVASGDSARVGAHVVLAKALVSAGDPAAGTREASEALAEMDRSGIGGWQQANVHEEMANALLDRHLFEAAASEVEKAIAGLDGANVAPEVLRNARQDRARCLAAHGQGAAALADAERELATEEKESGESSPHLLYPLLVVGEAALAARQPATALPPLEHAAAQAETDEGHSMEHADIHLALARALAATHGDPARVQALADRAAREYDAQRLPDVARDARAFASSALMR